MVARQFQPGFRLSVLDVIVIIAAVAGMTFISMPPWLTFVIGFVLVHFFLFCNVFRLSRFLELVWAGVFVILAASTIVVDMPGWIATIAVSVIVTVLVVVLEMRKPSYHGFAGSGSIQGYVRGGRLILPAVLSSVLLPLNFLRRSTQTMWKAGS